MISTLFPTLIINYDPDTDDSLYFKKDDELYALWNPTSDYSFSYDVPSAYKSKLDYEIILYYADIQNGTNNLFSPDGTVQIKGQNASYNLTILTDESECVTDWYALSVSGMGVDNVSLSKKENGYILSASNLRNVVIKAENNDIRATRTFSANADSVFIYEIDENTIGLRIDDDGDGTYETELPVGQDKFLMGDVNGDGIITIDDGTAIQKYLAEIIIFSDSQLMAANVNNDDPVTINDVTLIQKYLAELIDGFGS